MCRFPQSWETGEDARAQPLLGVRFWCEDFFLSQRRLETPDLRPEAERRGPGALCFKHGTANVYLIADAYRGSEIQTAILNFFDAAAGVSWDQITVKHGAQAATLPILGGSNLVAYVGHDGLMDFKLPRLSRQKNDAPRQAIILACASKIYFAESLRLSGAYPLLWTTNLMAPEAYTLESALDGWILGESNEQVRTRAAAAYDKYQKCGINGARRLIVSGW